MKSIKRAGLAAGLLAVCGIHAAIAAESDGWVSFGGGYYDGQDYERLPGQPESDAQEARGYEAMLAFNVTAPMLLRFRVAWMADYTSNTAEDVGVLVGLPVAEGRMFLAAGVSRLTDVSDQGQSPTVGVPVELLIYPTRGLEFALHGNFNPDSDFIGVTLAGVFGKRRAGE